MQLDMNHNIEKGNGNQLNTEEDNATNSMSATTEETEQEHDADMLDMAVLHAKNGRVLYQEHRYDSAIEEFKKSLKLRESFIGTYDTFTAGVYFFLGNCYLNMDDYDNAIVAFRTRMRIRRWLSPNSRKPSMDARTIAALTNQGFDAKQIEEYDRNLTKSVKYEKQGDLCRIEGRFSEAMQRYKQAVELEDAQVGKRLTIAFLWRKIAFLVGKKDEELNSSFELQQQDQEQQPSRLGCQETRISATSTDISLSSRLSARSSLSLEEEALCQTDVFQAIRNLAVEGGDNVDWKLVLDRIDIPLDMPQLLNERRVSFEEQNERLKKRTSLRLRRVSDSCDWQKKPLSSILFSLAKDGPGTPRTPRTPNSTRSHKTIPNHPSSWKHGVPFE